MKIIFICAGCGLIFLLLLPFIFNTFVNDAFKALLFYAGVILLLGGLGDVYEWLESRVQNNQDDLTT